ncbi:hypothetical protein [Comamonas thiooxydans]|uniref:hypothetical protein n=1 Tax=Comamonas thiooxydans TaxID=363952 RepID=UPI000B41359C|nr:hypothetical protein [Comamonas thiooxydans]
MNQSTDISSITFDQALHASATIPAANAQALLPFIPGEWEAPNPQAGALKDALDTAKTLSQTLLSVDEGLHVATVTALRALMADDAERLELNLEDRGGQIYLELVQDDKVVSVLWQITAICWEDLHKDGPEARVVGQGIRVRLNRFMEAMQAIGWVGVRTWFNYDEDFAPLALETIEDRAHALMQSRLSSIQAAMMTMMVDAATVGDGASVSMQATASNQFYAALRFHFNEQVRINTEAGIYEVTEDDH